MRWRILPGSAIAGAVAAVAFAGCGSSSVQSTTQTAARPAGPLIGVMFDGPVLGPRVNLTRQLDLAVSSGVESLRVAVDWSAMQPYGSAAEVPKPDRSRFSTVAGIPTQFSDLDRIVGATARRGLTILPVVESTPGWDALRPDSPGSPPKSVAPYATFLTALVNRYGPRGTFWSTHPGLPRVPIRMWQIWNEPHMVSYWSEQPFAPSYVKLLAAAHAAVKKADPGATVVLAGLANYSWRYLASIYRVPGARRLFDVVAIHPYTAQPRGVITILERARAVMNRFGDARKRMLATEITWPSSLHQASAQFGVSLTEQGQAQHLAALVPLLAENRAKLGLKGFYWYTWMGDESPRTRPYGFDYAGLLKYVDGTVTAKPALFTFRQAALALEHCRRKISAYGCVRSRG
jgi:hypothetical protein